MQQDIAGGGRLSTFEKPFYKRSSLKRNFGTRRNESEVTFGRSNQDEAVVDMSRKSLRIVVGN